MYGLCNSFFKKKIIASCYTINGTVKIQVQVNGPKKDALHLQDLIDLVGIEEVNMEICDHEIKQKRLTASITDQYYVVVKVVMLW